MAVVPFDVEYDSFERRVVFNGDFQYSIYKPDIQLHKHAEYKRPRDTGVYAGNTYGMNAFSRFKTHGRLGFFGIHVRARRYTLQNTVFIFLRNLYS